MKNIIKILAVLMFAVIVFIGCSKSSSSGGGNPGNYIFGTWETGVPGGDTYYLKFVFTTPNNFQLEFHDAATFNNGSMLVAYKGTFVINIATGDIDLTITDEHAGNGPIIWIPNPGTLSLPFTYTDDTHVTLFISAESRPFTKQ
jgi:hypothetical protein